MLSTKALTYACPILHCILCQSSIHISIHSLDSKADLVLQFDNNSSGFDILRHHFTKVTLTLPHKLLLYINRPLSSRQLLRLIFTFSLFHIYKSQNTHQKLFRLVCCAEWINDQLLVFSFGWLRNWVYSYLCLNWWTPFRYLRRILSIELHIQSDFQQKWINKCGERKNWPNRIHKVNFMRKFSIPFPKRNNRLQFPSKQPDIFRGKIIKHFTVLFNIYLI